MKTLEERIAEFKQGWTEEKKEIYRDCGDCWDKGYEDGREEALEIINELQQKNDLLQLDFNAAQELNERLLADRKKRHKELQSAKFKIESLEDKIKKLQQKNDLLQLDFNAAQEIMGGMNKEIEELKKQNKSWQQMVDSTNQTNQALCKRLRGSENETI